MTPGQKQALDLHYQQWGLEPEQGKPLDLDACFQREAPRILEIGFGMGDSLLAMARQHQDYDFLGIEVHRPGVGRLLANVEKHQLHNVRVISHDAVEIIKHHLVPASLDGILIFFPDPWPKKRHHKRRLVQTAFVELLATRLKSGAYLHLATDWDNYAEHMQLVLAQCALFNVIDSPPLARPASKFEQRGLKLGHNIHDLYYRLKPHDNPN